MQIFRVIWEIDVEAESDQDAARQAWAQLRKPDSTANCFNVVNIDTLDPLTGHGVATVVDLDAIETPAKGIAPPAFWHCAECGSLAVEALSWVDLNSGEATDESGGGWSDNWCGDCGDHVGLEFGHPFPMLMSKSLAALER